MPRAIRCLAVATGLALTAGCTASASEPSGDHTITQTVTRIRTRPPSPPATGPIVAGPTSAAPGACPFLDVATAASDVGVRMGRVEVLSSGGTSVGCRYYADQDPAYKASEHLPGPGQPVLSITSSRYRSATFAHNAMVRTAEAGTNARTEKLSAQVEGISFRTRFQPSDHGRDWAYAFRVGVTLVVVTTIQTDTAFDARAVGADIAGRF